MSNEARRFSGAEEARKWLVEVFTDWEQSLTQPEREAIYDYKQDNYGVINEALRNHEPLIDRVELQIEDLDLALSRLKLPEPIIVYRGFQGTHLMPELESLVGNIIEEDAYLSTSLLRYIAEDFCEVADDAALAEIMVPGGTNVAAFAGAPDLVDERFEYEILLPRSTFLQIHNTGHDGINSTLTMEVLTMEALT